MPTLSSIAITTPPAKTAYVAGETFDPSRMIVTAAYSDDSTAAVSDYSVSPSGSLALSDNVITVSYTEGDVTVTATVNITVKTRRITYTGQSKPIIRLAEAVNELAANFDITAEQIRQAVSDGWDAAFEEGGEQGDNSN